MARMISSKIKQGTPAELVSAGRVTAGAVDGSGNPDLFLEREETTRDRRHSRAAAGFCLLPSAFFISRSSPVA